MFNVDTGEEVAQYVRKECRVIFIVETGEEHIQHVAGCLHQILAEQEKTFNEIFDRKRRHVRAMMAPDLATTKKKRKRKNEIEKLLDKRSKKDAKGVRRTEMDRSRTRESQQ